MADDEEPEGEMERQLSCAVCLELYDDPLILPCLHSLCRKCVLKMTYGGTANSFKCPECQRDVHLKNEGESTLKRNFPLNNLVSVYKQDSQKRRTSSGSRQSLESSFETSIPSPLPALIENPRMMTIPSIPPPFPAVSENTGMTIPTIPPPSPAVSENTGMTIPTIPPPSPAVSENTGMTIPTIPPPSPAVSENTGMTIPSIPPPSPAVSENTGMTIPTIPPPSPAVSENTGMTIPTIPPPSPSVSENTGMTIPSIPPPFPAVSENTGMTIPTIPSPSVSENTGMTIPSIPPPSPAVSENTGMTIPTIPPPSPAVRKNTGMTIPSIPPPSPAVRKNTGMTIPSIPPPSPAVRKNTGMTSPSIPPPSPAVRKNNTNMTISSIPRPLPPVRKNNRMMTISPGQNRETQQPADSRLLDQLPTGLDSPPVTPNQTNNPTTSVPQHQSPSQLASVQDYNPTTSVPQHQSPSHLASVQDYNPTTSVPQHQSPSHPASVHDSQLFGLGDVPNECSVCEVKPPNHARYHCNICCMSFCDTCLSECHPKSGYTADHVVVLVVDDDDHHPDVAKECVECTLCDSHRTTTRCLQCQMNFCEQCLHTYHPTTESTTDHPLKPMHLPKPPAPSPIQLLVPQQPQLVPQQPQLVPQQPQLVPQQPQLVPQQPQLVRQQPQLVPQQPQLVPQEPQLSQELETRAGASAPPFPELSFSPISAAPCSSGATVEEDSGHYYQERQQPRGFLGQIRDRASSLVSTISKPFQSSPTGTEAVRTDTRDGSAIETDYFTQTTRLMGHPCYVCSEAPQRWATTMCLDCEFYFCDECSDKHLYPNHTVIDITVHKNQKSRDKFQLKLIDLMNVQERLMQELLEVLKERRRIIDASCNN